MTSISSLFNKTELTLLHSLKLSLRQTDSPVTALSLTEKDWEQVITLADRHEVLALLTPVLDLDRLSQKLWGRKKALCAMAICCFRWMKP